MLTHEQLKCMLEYLPESGLFIWKIPTKVTKAGDRAGYLNNQGYIGMQLLGKAYLAHRLAWFYVYGKWPINEIDHINSIKDDNRICNLRDISHSANQLHTRIPKSNTSGFKGVSWCKRANKWHVRGRVNKKMIHVGYFLNIKDAAKAYIEFAKKYHGEFFHERISAEAQ